jgi:hypothetical protein
LNTKIEDIVNLKCFEEVFLELEKVDANKTQEIRDNIEGIVKDIHNEIKDNIDNEDTLKLLLYKESSELKLYLNSFLQYSEMMAKRENALWQFAFILTEQFFELLSTYLDEYFSTKLELMYAELEKNHDWYSGLVDSGKKVGTVLNYSKKILKTGLDNISTNILDDKEFINTKSSIEIILEKYLDIDVVSKDIAGILEKAGRFYKESWEKEIKTQSPNLQDLRVFSNNAKSINLGIDYDFGVAEQTFTVGISAGIVGSIGLAAGWHTLSYALLNVFPPIAIFAAVSSLFVAFATKDKVLKNRKNELNEVVKLYHKHFLLLIETEKIKELNNNTLRESMNNQNREIIKSTVEEWGNVISGNYKIEHYRLLISAFKKHFRLIENTYNFQSK